VLKLIMLHLWGVIDPAIGFQFVPLWEDDSKTMAEVQKIKADTAAVYINTGIIAPEEDRKRIAADEESMYQGVDLSAPPPEPPEPEGGFGEEEDDGDEPPDEEQEAA
jgi:hypothetical protein